MERAEARKVLGVADDAGPDEVRAAYRRLVRTHHPDVAGAHHTRLAADITLAYRTLRAEEAPEPAGGPDLEVVRVERVDDSSFAIALPADEAFLCLLDVGHTLGEVTYVDPEGGLIQTIVQFDDGSTCAAVFTMQGRANGTTEVFCSLARLSPANATTPAPVAAIVVDEAARIIAGVPQVRRDAAD